MAINTSLVGGQSGILMEGANGIELYLKGGFDYYRLTCMYNPKTSDYDTSRVYSSESVDTQNLLEFFLTPKAGESGARSRPSELSYADLFLNSDIDFTGSQVYIRNDSPIHTYLINSGYDEYINVLKPYLYFGRLYPKSLENNIIIIETYYMKDFALDAIPEHQRTDNIREFFGVAFNELHSQVYYKMRDLLRLSDPFETKKEYLHYLLETFGTTTIVPSSSLSYDLDRFFINNLPALLKRKGTYESLVGIFRFLSNTINRLNIYEQWHDVLPSAAPMSASSIERYCLDNGYSWEEYLWTDYYTGTRVITAGAGERYYSGYTDYPFLPSSGKVLSPHYRVEIDLSTEPIETYEILKESTAEIIFEKLEELRPVARFCNSYGTVLLLKTDLTGDRFDTYDGLYSAYARTTCLTPAYAALAGNYFFSNWSSSDLIININHGLGTKELIVQTYTTDEAPIFKRFLPKNIIIIDENNITIELGSPQTFYAFIASKQYGTDEYNTFDASSSPATITGSNNYSGIQTIWSDNVDSYLYEMYPISHYISPPAEGSQHYTEILPPSGDTEAYYETSLIEGPSGLVPIGYDASFLLPNDFGGIHSSSYVLTHNLGTRAVIIDVLELHSDQSLSQIFVEDIIINDLNTITINVGNPSKDYVVYVRRISDNDFLLTGGDIVSNCTHVRLGNGLSTSLFTPANNLQREICDTYPSGGEWPGGVVPTHDSWYVQKSFEIQNAGIDGFSDYNVKIVLDIINNINITEIGLFDASENEIFYTTCSNLAAIAGTTLTLYYRISPTSIL